MKFERSVLTVLLISSISSPFGNANVVGGPSYGAGSSPTFYGGYGQQQQEYENWQQQQQQNTYEADPLQQQQQQQQPESEKPLPPGWSEHFDPSSGQPYYYNSFDDTTTWDRPLPVVEVEEKQEAEQQLHNDTSVEQGGYGEAADGVTSEEQKQSGQPTNVDDETSPVPQETPSPDSVASFTGSTDSGSVAEDDKVNEGDQSISPDEDSWRDNQGSWNQPNESTRSEVSAMQQQSQPGWGMPSQREEPPRSLGWGMPSEKAASHSQPDAVPPVQQERPGTPDKHQQPQQQFPPHFYPQQPPRDPRTMRPMGPGQQYDPRQNQFSGMQIPDDPNKRESIQSRPPQAGTPFARMTPQPQVPDATGPSPIQQGQYPPSRTGPPLQASAQQQRPPVQQRPPMQQQQEESNVQQPSATRVFGLPQPREPENRDTQQQQQQHRPPYPQQHAGQPFRPPPQQGGSPVYSQMPPQQRAQPVQPNQYGGQYNPYGQQQQQSSPHGYGSVYGGPPGYGQQQQQQQQTQMIVQEKPDAVRETLGKTWQGILGFSNRTREALETTKQTVATGYREAARDIQTKSTGWWGQAKSKLGFFDSSGGDVGSADYSLSGIYRNPQAPLGAQSPPGSYPQQQQPPPGYPQRPSQGYPPQRGQQGFPPGYPPQHQGPPPTQQFPPQGRYPPGYFPPEPRSDVPYPPPGQQQGPRQAQPPFQSQYGPGYPPQNRPGYPPQNNPRPQGGRPGVPSQPQQTQQDEKDGEQRRADPWQHPGLGPEY